jgi:hypothetical protein
MARIPLILTFAFLILILPVIVISPSQAQSVDKNITTSPLTPISTSTNNTYENTPLGIEFNIPTDWIEKDFKNDVGGGNGVNFTFPRSDSAAFFLVNVTNNKNNQTLSELANSTTRSIQNIIKQSSTTLSGLPAYEIVSLKKVPSLEQGEDSQLNVTDILTTNNNKTYQIKYGADIDDREPLSTFKDILATFKIDNLDMGSASSLPLNNNNGSIGNQTQKQEVAPLSQQALLPLQQQPLQQQQQQPLRQQQQQPLQQQPFIQPYQPPMQQQPYQPPMQQQPYQPPMQQQPFPQQPAGTLPRILSQNSYTDSNGDLHIVGEVINETYQPVRYVRITATFYDANNRVIGTDYTFTTPSTLQPGQRAPFDLTVSEGSVPTYLMAHYALSVD